MTNKFEYCHGFHDPVSEYMEHPYHGRCITNIFKGCHDPVARYVENICSKNGELCVCNKE